MFRQSIVRSARLFSTSVPRSKGPVETAKDAIHSVDKTVSQTIVKGIEKGEQAAGKAQEATGMGAGEAKQKAQEAAGDVKQKAQEVANQAENKAHEVKGEVKQATK